MTITRPALLAIIGLLSLVCVVAVAALIHERNKADTVEIRLDERGLRINGR